MGRELSLGSTPTKKGPSLHKPKTTPIIPFHNLPCLEHNTETSKNPKPHQDRTEAKSQKHRNVEVSCKILTEKP